jgi:predicted dienelactone hydrolase
MKINRPTIASSHRLMQVNIDTRRIDTLGTMTNRAYIQASAMKLLGIGLASLLSMGSATAQVGMTQIRAGDMPVTVVYPTEAAAVHKQFGPFDLEVATDAAPSRDAHRLIVMSHGTGGDAFSLHTLARTLALAGFVVAQPEHRGDNWQDRSDSGVVSWQRRPGEVSKAIDAVAADVRFAGTVGFDRVGVYGISAGGGTALALAGADWSLWSWQHHCAAHSRDDSGFCLYGVRSEAEAIARAQSYLKPLPPNGDDLLAGARVSDPRIAAVAVSVPVGAIFTPQSLAAIRMPVGIVEAQADKVLKPEFHSGYVLAHCAACKLLDSVRGGGHFDTLSPWPESVAKAAAQAPGAQRNPAIDDARRQQSYDRIANFFDEHLLP